MAYVAGSLDPSVRCSSARRISVTTIRPVILSGGSGTRLWPLSTPELPKQFVPLVEGRSLFELTLQRLGSIAGVAPPLVVTGAAHVPLVMESLAGFDGARVLVEPVGRNTAPASVAAAMVANEDDVLIIVPSDQLIADTDGFATSAVAAATCAEEGGIVTFGITPDRPETGYGYIEKGEPARPGTFEVSRFKEKPGSDEAVALANDGRHLWNSGMFVVTASDLLAEARVHCPDIVAAVSSALDVGSDRVIELGQGFADVRAISFDYAIMEKTDRALVFPLDVGWDDVGSYRSLLDALPKDGEGNHVDGDITLRDVSGSFVVATSRRVAVAGMSDVVVVETPDVVLVVPLNRSQEVRELVQRTDG